MLNSLRQGVTGIEPAAAIVTAALGIAVLVVIALAGGKPLGRATLLQTGGLAVLLSVAAGIGVALTEGISRIAFIGGAVGAILAFVLVLVFRARDREATAQIDSGLEYAHLDVAPEVRVERERMMRELASELAGSPDIAAMRRMRSATIEELRGLGNPVIDTEPESLPGAYIVEVQTAQWIPLPLRQDVRLG